MCTFCRDRSDTRTEAAFYPLVSEQESCLALIYSREPATTRIWLAESW